MAEKNRTKVLAALMRNSKKSDRAIAEEIGISQPTVTRIRQQLFANGYIKAYTIVPNLAKLGYVVISVAEIKITEKMQVPEFREALRKDKRTIFAGRTHDKIIAVSRHKDFSSLRNFNESHQVAAHVEISTTDRDIIKEMVVRSL